MPVVVGEDVERYQRALLDRHDEEVLVAMEAVAAERNFPIVGRAVGVTLEILARAIGARRVFELGSGFGYSAYWFARAVGAGGVVFCTDGDPANRDAAADNLTAAGLWNRVDFRVSDAVTSLRATEGEFDIVYNDVDKLGYPEAWRAARDRVRMGGFYICDNVLWSGYVASEPPADRPGMEGRGWTEAILEHNQAVSDDPDFLSVIVPTRDGVMVALRIS